MFLDQQCFCPIKHTIISHNLGYSIEGRRWLPELVRPGRLTNWVTPKTRFMMIYLTQIPQKLELYDNPQQRGVCLPFILPCRKSMVSIMQMKEFSLKLTVYLKGAENFTYSCMCIIQWARFFLYKSNTKAFEVCWSLASSQLCRWNSDAVKLWANEWTTLH